MKHSITAKLAKGWPALVAAAVLSHSPIALAGPAIGFDPSGTGTFGALSYSDLWTNNTDSALSVGFDPTNTTPIPYTIQLLSQASVAVLKKGATNVTPTGMNPTALTDAATCSGYANGCFELTKVVNVKESVTSNDGTNANFGMATQTADVDGNGGNGLQQLAIYFDPLTSGTDSGIATPGDGAGTVSGYTDGTLILSALTMPLRSQ